jgi:predicted ATPase/transcriptional regulator with XRE-family HTH domain
MSFAEMLRALRESRSLTQEELAERAGVTVKAVGALERAERLRPYPHTVRALADGLGLDEIERASLVESVPSRGQRSPSSTTAFRSTVSPQSAPILGRDEELAAVCDLLRSGRRRLVTVTGPGGVGKTRLSLEVAARLQAEFPSGTVVVELAAVREPAMVLPRIAAALDIPESSGARTAEELTPFLAGRRILLVLDNLEQLLGAASVVAQLVVTCPELVVLATSRAPLRVRAEQEVPLAPLPVPEEDTLEAVAGSPAVGMFLDRVEAGGTPLTLTVENAAAIAAICRRLDGLPLAIELAAAGARMLTPVAILDRLDDLGADAGIRDLPDRQRTMTATLDWSHDLLDVRARSLFAQLAVFSDGFSLDSVEDVAGSEVLQDLGTLVEQSLVLRVPAPDDQPRFRLLEPVRQYAAARRDASAATTPDRHAEHFHSLAVEARAGLRGPGVVGLLDRLEADHANLRSAYLRLLETDHADDAAELAGDLWLYLALRGHAREGLRWLDRLDDHAVGDAARARALTGRAGLMFVTGDIVGMRVHAETALALAMRRADDTVGAEAATLAGHAAVFTGETTAARQLLDQGWERAEAAGDEWARTHLLVAKGQLALLAGDLDAADPLLRTAEEHARSLGNAFTLATALNRRATVTALRDDHATTADLLVEATDIAVSARINWTLSYSLPALAGVAVRLREPVTAAALFGASASLSAAHSIDPRFPVSKEIAERDLVAVRAQLGDQAFRAAWDTGRAASGSTIAELAGELSRRARG